MTGDVDSILQTTLNAYTNLTIWQKNTKGGQQDSKDCLPADARPHPQQLGKHLHLYSVKQ